MSVDYTPSFDPADVDSDYGSTGGDITVPTFTANMKPFRFWCQKALPLVYDDSLSYYEVLCKVVDQMNGFLTDLQTATGSIEEFAQQFVINQQFLNDMAEQLGQNVDDLETYINERMEDFTSAYEQLQSYVNNYFDNLDVQQEINNKLDTMAANGTFNTLFDPVITAWMTAKTAQIDEDLSNQNQTIANQNSRISVLEGRMDTFASLPAGSTSGNAELVDIRTNFLGEIFSSAGDAVRVSDLLASGFSSQPIIYDWIGETLGFGYFDTTRYKGGKIAFIVNTAYNGITEYGRLYIGNTATEIDPTIRLYPDSDTDPDHAHVSDYLDEYQEKILTSNENGTRFLVTFSIPSTFRYLYIGTSVSRGTASTGLPQPDFIVYASNWIETPIDPTLTQPNEAADAKATGDAIRDLDNRVEDAEESIFTVTERTLHTGYPIGTPGHAYTGNLNNAYVWVWVDNYVPKGAVPTIKAWTTYAGNVHVILFNKNDNGSFTPKYDNSFAIATGASGSEISIPQSYFDDADTYLGFYSVENATAYNSSGDGGVNTQRCNYSDIAIGTPVQLTGSFPTFDQSITVSYKKVTDKISDLTTQVEELDDKLESVKSFVVVAKDGSGDYTSVKDAVYTEAENTVIIVKPGIYTEETIDARGKRIILIGTDRNQCIIQNPNGLYANPTFWVGCGYFENLTILAPYISGTSEEVDGNTMGAYAIHCDTTNYNIDKQLEFHHCTLQSDFFPAMGVGLRKGFTLIIDDCELINNQITGRGDYSDAGTLGALYFHDADGTVGEQYIKVHDSVLKSNLQYAMTPYKAYGQEGVIVNCEFINNVLFSKTHGLTNNIWFRNNPFDPSTGNFKLVIGFGNSNDSINS